MTIEENSSLELETIVLSPEIIKIFKQQTIDENQPGTILKDFQILLDYIGEKGIAVTGINSFFPMKLFAEINSRLTHPIFLDLKRPVQKSYPNIHGLYLLLRTSGLTLIKSRGKKKFLVVDPIVLQSWNRLNWCERYFALLEIWLIWATDEAIGEATRDFNLSRCLRFEQVIGSDEIKITKKNQDSLGLNSSPGLHNLALLDMFGLLTIEHLKPENGKGWHINSIKKTVFGKAMFQFFSPLSQQSWKLWKKLEHGPRQYLFLHSQLQSYFPNWQNILMVSEPEFIERIYIFKVKFDEAWRRIAIPGFLELEELVNSILEAFNYDKDYLYQFICKDRFGKSLRISDPSLEEEPYRTDAFQVGRLPLKVGEKMMFWVDFGHDCKFEIWLEEINSLDPNIKYPQILKSSGNPPQQYLWNENWDSSQDWDFE